MSRKTDRIWAQRSEAILLLAASSTKLNVNSSAVNVVAGLFNSSAEDVCKAAEEQRAQIKAALAAKAEKDVVAETVAEVTAPVSDAAADLAAQIDARLAAAE